MAIIEVDGLTKYYGETRGIEELTFTVGEGEVFGFLGPNGAGKTTTIRTLMGLQAPTSGRATVLGYNVLNRRDRRVMKGEIGYLPSDPSFDEEITGQQLLAYHGSLKSDERSDELLELFDPPTDRVIGALSDENVQTLAIVLAFMHDPDLVIMDEPTSRLDSSLRERLYGFLRMEKERGTTIFVSSHLLREVRTICDRVGVIRNGHIITVENIAVLDHGGKSVRVKITEPVDADDFVLDGAHDIEITRRRSMNVDAETPETVVQFTYTGAYDALIEQLHDYTVVDIEIAESPLEEIFARLYGERLGTIEAGGSDV